MTQLTLPSEERQDLLEHVFGTYSALRLGMAGIAFAFPLVLLVAGYLHGLQLQGSMSAYYWASIEGDPPVRVWFVGGLFAIGSLLFLYKGYSAGENWALNLAGGFAIGVALFPMSWRCGTEQGYCQTPYVHAGLAVAFFACVVYVALVESRKSLCGSRDEAFVRRYKNRYRITSALLALSPVAAIVAHMVFRQYDALTYFVELFGTWAFVLFWVIKSWELHKSRAEKQVLDVASETVASKEAVA